MADVAEFIACLDILLHGGGLADGVGQDFNKLCLVFLYKLRIVHRIDEGEVIGKEPVRGIEGDGIGAGVVDDRCRTITPCIFPCFTQRLLFH